MANFYLRSDQMANFYLRSDQMANFYLRSDKMANFYMCNDQIRSDKMANFLRYVRTQKKPDYCLSLIKDTIDKTRFMVTKDSNDMYNCYDNYGELGIISIGKNRKTHLYCMFLDDSIYDYVDFLRMKRIGLTMDQFLQNQFKSLEDLTVHLSKIIYCLPYSKT
jgi:hypothetical protein